MTEPSDAWSRFAVFVDESGDHGPPRDDFPVFIMSFCVFDLKKYATQVVPMVHWLKFKHFGHDQIALHSSDIRHRTKEFGFGGSRARHEALVADVSAMMTSATFTLIAVAIDKRKLWTKYTKPENPYNFAMQLGLERIEMMRSTQGDSGPLRITFEARGKREDAEAQEAFGRAVESNACGRALAFEASFVAKDRFRCGLEIADLAAHPVARHVLKPDQPNRAFDAIRPKFRSSPEGEIKNWGLKIFP